jgi:hypothetical protein
MDTYADRQITWLMSGDTGVSSETIFGVMTGRPTRMAGVPYDRSDFGRCYRLLAMFPEWRDRLEDVADKYPSWAHLVQQWGYLERLYENDSGDFGNEIERIRTTPPKEPTDV